MKYFLSFLVLVLAYTSSYGQAAGTVNITETSSCTAYTLCATFVGTTPTNTGLYSDDSYTGIIPIGFTYNFYGNNYTQLVIGENGQLTFTTSLAGGYDPWPITAPLLGNTSALNTVCAPWCDIDGAVAMQPIEYSTQGTAPNRTFAATWCGLDMYSCTAQWTTTQIIIYETTGVAEAHIGHKTSCAWNGGYAIVGVQNAAGTAATVAPGRDYPAVWTATNEGWRFTPNAGATAYTVTSIPYAPIPYASSTVYWYDSTTHAYLHSGSCYVVSPTATTTYKAAVLGCKDTTAGYITVGPAGSNAPISGILTLCQGGTTQLSVGSTGGTWSSVSPGVATVNPTTGLVYGVSAGTAVINYTGTLICTGTTTVTVVHPGAIAPATICAGGTITLSDSPAGGSWSSSNTNVATIGLTSGIATGVATGTTTVSYDVGAGCITSGPLTVVLLSGITGITTVCQGSTITLNDAAGGGTWVSGNAAVAAINLTTGVVTGVSQGTAAITYTVPGGCYTTTTVTVNPTDPITGVASLCQRRATTTLANASTGGTWSSANPGIATITPATGIVYGVSGGVATISYVNTYGCISTIAVTVDPTPPPPGVTPQTYCQYYLPALPFVATGAGPTFTWWGPGVTAGYPTSPTPSTAVPGVTTYYVTQTSSFGCESDSSSVTVTIIPQPAPPVTDSATYCQFFPNPSPLTAQVITATGTLSWYLNGLLLTGTPTPPTAIATYPAGTTWYVAQTVNGCESDSSSINVDIVYKPDFTITAQPWVCQFDSISLAYTATGPALIDGSFLWSLPMGAILANGTSLTDPTIYAQFDSVNQNNYVYLTASNLGGECSTTDTILINVIQLPTATATSKADVCLSDTVTLALSSKSASAINFTWYIDNSPLFSSPAATIIAANSNSGGPYSISWTDTGMHIIHVQPFTENGCTSKLTSDTVYVHSLPDASFYITTSSGTLCLEDSVLFSANDSNYQNNYSWAPVHFFGNNNIDKHAVWGKVEQTQSIVTLTITDPFGCIASNSKELDPSTCCNITFPNAFSPNGDGKDDVFRPIPSTAYHTYHKFVIQNRWGQIVFESANNQASWDGTFNGVPQDIGVYYYYLKYDCGGNTLEQKGDVTLVR